MIRIDREEYLDFLIKSKDKKIIKVVSGVSKTKPAISLSSIFLT